MIRQELVQPVDIGGIECIEARKERLFQLLQFRRLIERLIVLIDLGLHVPDAIICGLRIEEEQAAGGCEEEEGEERAGHIIGSGSRANPSRSSPAAGRTASIGPAARPVAPRAMIAPTDTADLRR